jgi:hypothetical protein
MHVLIYRFYKVLQNLSSVHQAGNQVAPDKIASARAPPASHPDNPVGDHRTVQLEASQKMPHMSTPSSPHRSEPLMFKYLGGDSTIIDDIHYSRLPELEPVCAATASSNQLLRRKPNVALLGTHRQLSKVKGRIVKLALVVAQNLAHFQVEVE